jgi:glucosamine--fructose-6-phosphate aminotransferase (isomerizing)
MLKEILEQPSAIQNTLEKGQRGIEKVSDELSFEPQTLYLVGSGSSYCCGRIFSYIYEFLTKKKAISCYSLEFAKYNKDIVTKNDLIFVLSQSGETRDAIQAAKAAKAASATTIGVTNNPNVKLSKITDFTLLSHAGKEKSIPSTKSFTSMLAILTLFALEQTKSKLVEKMFEIPALLEQTFHKTEKECKEIGNHFVRENVIDIVGDGINYPVALEGALKMKETAHMHAQGMPVGEYWHGHISLVAEGYPLILTCPGNEKRYSTLELIKRLSILCAYTPIVSFENLIKEGIGGGPLLYLPRTDPIFSPFLSVPIFQLIAYHSSIAKGLNPDKPVGLHKVVK